MEIGSCRHGYDIQIFASTGRPIKMWFWGKTAVPGAGDSGALQTRSYGGPVPRVPDCEAVEDRHAEPASFSHGFFQVGTPGVTCPRMLARNERELYLHILSPNSKRAIGIVSCEAAPLSLLAMRPL